MNRRTETDGCTDRWTNVQDERMDVRTDSRMDRQTDGKTERRIGKWIHEQIDRQTDVRTDGQTVGQKRMNRHRQTSGRKDRQRWRNGQTEHRSGGLHRTAYLVSMRSTNYTPHGGVIQPKWFEMLFVVYGLTEKGHNHQHTHTKTKTHYILI